LPQGKGARQRHKTLVNKHKDKPTPKQSRTTNRLQSCHTLLQEKLNKQQLLKDRRRKKKTLPTGRPPGKTKTELLLKYQHEDWIMEE
jgi:hypothetical protein